MITRHNIKAYALANGWEETPNAIEGLEVFQKNNLIITFPIVINPETETHSLYYAVDKICSDELGNVIDVYNRIANQWLPFNYRDIAFKPVGTGLLLNNNGVIMFFEAVEEENIYDEMELLWYSHTLGYLHELQGFSCKRYPHRIHDSAVFKEGCQYKLVPLPQQ